MIPIKTLSFKLMSGLPRESFYHYLTTDDDASKEKSVRSGGFGSTTSKEADK